jgi:hypothetical protein
MDYYSQYMEKLKKCLNFWNHQPEIEQLQPYNNHIYINHILTIINHVMFETTNQMITAILKP